MLTHDDAFLADIAENPDDDAPRLIYADWLEDRGDLARSEFIRVQIERSRLAPSDPRQVDLLRREGELRLESESAWVAQMPHFSGVTWEDFSRGFVEAAFVETVADFLRHADALFAAAPIRRLQIGTLDAADARRLAQSKALLRLTELNVGNNPLLGRSGLGALVNSPHVGNLMALLLHNNELGDEAIAELTTSPHLGNLVELYLSGNDLADEGIMALAHSSFLPRLAELDLRDNRIGNRAVRALSESNFLGELTTLYLVNNQVGGAGATALARSLLLPQLARVYLNYNPVGNEGATAFAVWPCRQRLVDLDLRHCEIRDEGGLSLARSENLPALEYLWLGGNRFRQDILALLRARFGARLRF